MNKTALLLCVGFFLSGCPVWDAFGFELSDLPEAALEWADAEIEGALRAKKMRGDGSEVSTTHTLIRGQRVAFEKCIKENLPKGQDASLTLKWKMQPTGQLSDIHILEQLYQKGEMEACLKDALMQVTWPAFEGDAKNISLPFKIKHKK